MKISTGLGLLVPHHKEQMACMPYTQQQRNREEGRKLLATKEIGTNCLSSPSKLRSLFRSYRLFLAVSLIEPLRRAAPWQHCHRATEVAEILFWKLAATTKALCRYNSST